MPAMYTRAMARAAAKTLVASEILDASATPTASRMPQVELVPNTSQVRTPIEISSPCQMFQRVVSSPIFTPISPCSPVPLPSPVLPPSSPSLSSSSLILYSSPTAFQSISSPPSPALPYSLHIQSPLISPRTIPSKAEELRLSLSSFCPGCSSRSLDRNTTVAELATLFVAYATKWKHRKELSGRLRVIKNRITRSIHQVEMGHENAQAVIDAAKEVEDIEKGMYKTLEDMVRLETRQARARRRWGEGCEGLFGERKKKVKAKGRVRAKVEARRRWLVDVYYPRSSTFWLSTELLALP